MRYWGQQGVRCLATVARASAGTPPASGLPVNKTTGNSSGESSDAEASDDRERGPDSAPVPSPDAVDNAWALSGDEALLSSEAGAPVDASADGPESIPDEVTPPRTKLSELEVEREVTQELSPEELDIQPAPPRPNPGPAPRQTPAAGVPAAPITQLALSDLFDSSPPPGSVTLEPPNPLEFASSRPPPGAPQPPRPMFEAKRGDPRGGVVALPSIPVGAEPAS